MNNMIPVFPNATNDRSQKAIGYASCLSCAADIVKQHFDNLGDGVDFVPTLVQLSSLLFVGIFDYDKYGVKKGDISHDDLGNCNITGYFASNFVEKPYNENE